MASLVRVRRVSRVLGWFATILAVVLPIGAVALFAMLGYGDLMGVPALLVSFLGYLVTLAAWIIGLLYLRRLFFAYAAGEFFSVRNANRICGFGWAIVAGNLLMPVSGALISVASAMDSPRRDPEWLRTGYMPQLDMLLIGGFVLVIGWVMREAVRLAEENAAIV